VLPPWKSSRDLARTTSKSLSGVFSFSSTSSRNMMMMLLPPGAPTLKRALLLLRRNGPRAAIDARRFMSYKRRPDNIHRGEVGGNRNDLKALNGCIIKSRTPDELLSIFCKSRANFDAIALATSINRFIDWSCLKTLIDI
jgi:hypothetical protein